MAAISVRAKTPNCPPRPAAGYNGYPMEDHHLRVYDSILGLLSSADNPTPLVRLNHVAPHEHTQIFAKLEWYNPFGAIKDRVAANLVRDAESRGDLVAGQRLVEPTSGNTGLGLAMIGNAKGYPLQTTVSGDVPMEKRTVLRAFGSDVQELDDTLCPAPGAPEGAIAKAREAAESQPDLVMLDQYRNRANPQSHYLTTGPEIWKQTAGRITHFIASLGTCGTITGTGRYLKQQNANIQVIGVCPDEGHDIPGVRSQIQLQQTELYHPDEYDGTVEVTNRQAYDMTLRLIREESIIAGPSSGLALVGALAKVPDAPGLSAVVIFPDNAFKYASSFQRHFPEICPPNPSDTAPSTNDRFVAELIENLKNRHDTIKAADLLEKLNGPKKPLVIDVRPAEDFAQGHIAGSINIAQDDLSHHKSDLPEDRNSPIIMVCNIGRFSKHTTLYLKSLGYRNVRSMKGGLNEWARKGHPTQPETNSSS